MTSHEQFRQEVYGCFSSVEDDAARAVLEWAIVNAPDVDGILLMTRESAAHNKPFRATGIHSALRGILVGHRPIEFSNMQEAFSLPGHELRKGLFDLVVNGNAAESRLATECLSAIDEIRDDYGHVDAEPRHPNIAAGVPWPKIDRMESS